MFISKDVATCIPRLWNSASPPASAALRCKQAGLLPGAWHFRRVSRHEYTFVAQYWHHTTHNPPPPSSSAPVTDSIQLPGEGCATSLALRLGSRGRLSPSLWVVPLPTAEMDTALECGKTGTAGLRLLKLSISQDFDRKRLNTKMDLTTGKKVKEKKK
ncbi:hypothetical protein H1C71_008432 [Ictidomys tridecemlineatus]|nr:hypothetical protein H1C71_008432 [Ictidomys tridecemlineatus]